MIQYNNQTHALFIAPEGTSVAVKPPSGHWRLEELQQLVRGHIEIVELGSGEVAIINEEGKLEGLPVNQATTYVWYARCGARPDVLVGNVLFCFVLFCFVLFCFVLFCFVIEFF